MKKDLKIYHIPHHSDEWFEFRKNGIGGSEIGTVLGINNYDTNVRLFHEKIGNIEHQKFDNERMFWGRINEDNIARIWSYYDGTKDGYVENFNNGKIVRKCRNINGYIVNPKYPWLFASVDRLINKDGGFNLITGEPLEQEGLLECKNMSYWVSQRWEDGIPIYHLAQIHQYMAILEIDYAEIAMLVDGGTLQVEKIQRDDELVERILEISKDFWYNRVVPAREAVKKRDLVDMEGNMHESEKWEAEIQRVEPYPDDSEAYSEFMNEKFVKVRETIDGTMELYHLAKRDNFLRALKKAIDTQRTGIKNVFIRFLNQGGAESIDFGKLGVVNWSERKGAKSRTFNNRTKEKPSEEYVEEQLNKIDQNGF
jgi:putative phage-type endonuclease